MNESKSFGDLGSDGVRHLLEALELTNVCVRDLDGTIRFWSHGNELLYGWSAAESLGRVSHSLLQTQFPGQLTEIESALFSNGMWTGELRHRRKDGRPLEVASHWLLKTSTDGSHTVVEINSDISDRKRAEHATQYLASIVTCSDDAIISKDLNGVVTSWNQGAERLFGYASEEMVGRSILKIFPPERMKEELTLLGLVAKGHQVKHYETERVSKSGDRLPVSVSISPIKDNDGRIVGAAKIVRNISQQKIVEEALRRSLEEKAALLQEVHHRVKNNLTVVASLLAMQADSSDDPKLAQKLKNSERRVLSMAAIHDLLYRHENVNKVEFAQYTRKLVSQMFSSYTLAPGLSYKVDLAPVEVAVEQAVPCGLILNELVTNAIKYAYPGGRGEVFIGLVEENGEVKLTVTDRGVGIPPGLDLQTGASLGLRLLNLLVGQLDGRLERGNAPGTSFTVIFPKISDRKGGETASPNVSRSETYA